MKIIFTKQLFQILRQKLERYSSFNVILFQYYDKFWLIKNKLNNLTGQFDEDKRYWINPEKIIYTINREKNVKALKSKSKSRSIVLAGDWDLPKNLKTFSRNLKYRSFYQHFINGKPWTETEYYRKMWKSISEGRKKFECLSKEDMNRRFQFLDKLYSKIKTEGYKSQIELAKSEGKLVKTGAYTRVRKYGDEIRIAIGRDGTPIFLGGRHRLMIAQLLRIESVPVKIQIIHKLYSK